MALAPLQAATFGRMTVDSGVDPVVPGRCAPSTTGFLPASLLLAQTHATH